MDSLLTKCLQEASNKLPPGHLNYDNYHGKIESAQVVKGMCVIKRRELNKAHRRIPESFLTGSYTEEQVAELARNMLEFHCDLVQHRTFKPNEDDPDCDKIIKENLESIGKLVLMNANQTLVHIDKQDHKSLIKLLVSEKDIGSWIVLDAFIDPEYEVLLWIGSYFATEICSFINRYILCKGWMFSPRYIYPV